MNRSVVRFVSITSVIVLLASSAFLWNQWSQSIESDEEEYEEERGENKLAGVYQQLGTWFLSKGYPNPQGLAQKYERSWEQHLALKAYTQQLLSKSTGGKNPKEILMGNKLKGLSPIQETVAGTVSGTGGFGNWTAFGPKIFGGRILCLAINPNLNANGKRTIFAGSASGGIWRTDVSGEGATAWRPVPTGFPVLGVSALVYHPTNTQVLLAGTGEVYRVQSLSKTVGSTSYQNNQLGNIGFNVWRSRGTYGIGILRSADGGNTWTKVLSSDMDDLFGIQQIRFDPNNPSRVYACATNALYRSLDAGLTWTKIWDKIYVSDVAIDPTNSNTIVVAAGNLVNTDKGVWRSTNGGSSFTKVSTGTTGGLPTFRGFIKFDVGGGRLLASVGGASTQQLYSSTDFGATWTAQSGTNFTGPSDQFWFAHDVEINPASPNRVVLGGVNTFRYTIGGTTMTQIGTGNADMNISKNAGDQEGPNTYLHDDIHDIEFVPGSSTEMYVASDGGIFKGVFDGAFSSCAFTSCNGGLQVHQFYGPSAQSQISPLFIGGLQDNNTIRFNGTAWSRVIGGDGGPSMFKPGGDDIVIASRDARNILQSINKGVSFTQRLSNLGQTHDADARTGFMAPMAVSAANPAIMYVASDNLHVSLNSGGSFDRDGPTTMTKPIEQNYKTALALAVSPTNADKLYISLSPLAQVSYSDDNLYYNPPANVWKITNGSKNTVAFAKTKVTSNLPDRFVMDFAIHPTNDEIVYAAVGGFGTDHVYVTKNGGTTWAPLGTGMLPDVPINTVMLDPNNPNIIYAGSDLGVYVSPDAGATWLDYGNGFWDATYVIDLVVAPGATPGSKKLRAVTHGKGIFDSPLLELSALPVTFNSFKGQKQEQHNLLQWTVSEESQLESYQVEKSTDGIAYKTVATVRARNLDGTQVYEHKDYQVGGSFYYRIKSVDLDGTYQYSSVVFLNRSNGEKMTLLVNPVTTTIPLQFHVLQKGTVALRLVNNAGQVIRAAQASLQAGTSNYNLSDLQSLPQGVYYLEATFNRQRWVEKVVKN